MSQTTTAAKSAPKKESAPKAAPAKAAKPASSSGNKLVVILVRGRIGLINDQLHTLDLLKLQKRHICCVYPDTPSLRGMIQKVNDLVTWGELSDATLKTLEEKRGKSANAKAAGKENANAHFHLHPPRGGFERKGIKVQFSKGGALGYRGDKINALIERML